jgi:hypothetical protein
MPQLHETIMGERLIKSVLPDIADQLKRIADALEDKEIRTENAVTNLIKQFPNDQELGKQIRQRWQKK